MKVNIKSAPRSAYRHTIKLIKAEENPIFEYKIKASKHVCEMAKKVWDLDAIAIQESMYAFFLNRQNNLIGWALISTGGITGTVIDVRLLFSYGLQLLATSLIIIHNHPSGNLEPSDADKKITRQIREAGVIMDMHLTDHLIVVPDSMEYYSFADDGTL